MKTQKKWRFSIIISITCIVVILLTFFILFDSQQSTTEHSKTIEKFFREVAGRPEVKDKKIYELEVALDKIRTGNSEESERAKDEIKRGNYRAAQKLLEKVWEEEPKKGAKHADIIYALGHAYYLGVKYEKALAAYQEAERLVPGNSNYINSIGLTHLEFSQYNEAVLCFEKALK